MCFQSRSYYIAIQLQGWFASTHTVVSSTQHPGCTGGCDYLEQWRSDTCCEGSRNSTGQLWVLHTKHPEHIWQCYADHVSFNWYIRENTKRLGLTTQVAITVKVSIENLPFICRGQDILGSTVGLAYLGTMCNRDVAIGFTQDGGEGSIESVGAIAAHELGHIFNMRHDSSSKWLVTIVWQTVVSAYFKTCRLPFLFSGFTQETVLALIPRVHASWQLYPIASPLRLSGAVVA